MKDRLGSQMRFLQEADRLKTVERSNVLLDLSRHENSAEHSWHAALFALVLAEDAPEGCDLDRAIAMLLLHDLVEIDAGDHPVDQDHDAAEIARKEQLAADRLYGLLPADQGASLRALWEEFEAGLTPSAVYAKRIDHVQPILQVLLAPKWYPGHTDIALHTLRQGRARRLATDWPEIADLCEALAERKPLPDTAMGARLRFLAEADQLKHVLRASPLGDNSRFENSAEHSWHVALWALVLAEHSAQPSDVTTVIKMLLLHDLVEIDAGDNPVFGDHIPAEQDAQEQAAADRIFGLLPMAQAQDLRDLWNRFEAHDSPDADFGKALDRAAPPVQNLASGGGSWIAYDVTWEMFETRVARKIAKGAPAVWDWLRPRVQTRLAELAEARDKPS